MSIDFSQGTCSKFKITVEERKAMNSLFDFGENGAIILRAGVILSKLYYFNVTSLPASR